MFSYNGTYGGVMLQQQPRCSVVHCLTPLLRDIGCVLSHTTASFKTRRVFRARGAGGEVCDAPLFVNAWNRLALVIIGYYRTLTGNHKL